MNEELESQRLATKITVDIVCLFAVGVPILIFYVAGKPYERGFYCDDESLRHPYLDSTVPSWSLYLVGLGLPIIIILIVEYIIYARQADVKRRIRILTKKIPVWIWECYCHIVVFGFGAACSQLTTDIAKYTIGRLRPHFFDVCKPDIDCTDPKYKFIYVENFHCQQTNEKLLKDMRLSFPSGHSSFSAYCMIFIVMYLQIKLTWKNSTFFKHVLQFICLSLAFYTALSRISDYKHHWSDVLAGSALGALVAILNVTFVSNLIPKSDVKYVNESTSADRMENELSAR